MPSRNYNTSVNEWGGCVRVRGEGKTDDVGLIKNMCEKRMKWKMEKNLTVDCAKLEDDRRTKTLDCVVFI
ncbi:hypothetical protein B9Z55_019391 [Caenorhabditis nigoni]|uniref:Uncharacterized protein n=1 Tax=Caenorhabditis nigoni TaxID=1611254 RepID=A0A2G5TI55_9PELO|nr:hypothetical protein B9Z55_019391 [Caenorhabditis nigoni]